jgi:hypothetical protein
MSVYTKEKNHRRYITSIPLSQECETTAEPPQTRTVIPLAIATLRGGSLLVEVDPSLTTSSTNGSLLTLGSRKR